MDAISALTLALSIFGTGLAAYSLLYTKRQVDMQRRDFDKKKSFEKASNTLLHAITIIKEVEKPTTFESLKPIQVDIVKELYDNPHLVPLIIKIKPISLNLGLQKSILRLGKSYYSFDEGKEITIKDRQELINTLMEWANRKVNFSSTLRFSAEPNILKNNSISITELTSEFRMYYIAYNLLLEQADLIRPFDASIIGEIKETIDNMVIMLFESTIKEHTLDFDSTEKSDDILTTLIHGIIYMDSIVDLRKALIALCDGKLIVVQHKLFEMAYQ